jgi:hypothetical protein
MELSKQYDNSGLPILSYQIVELYLLQPENGHRHRRKCDQRSYHTREEVRMGLKEGNPPKSFRPSRRRRRKYATNDRSNMQDDNGHFGGNIKMGYPIVVPVPQTTG